MKYTRRWNEGELEKETCSTHGDGKGVHNYYQKNVYGKILLGKILRVDERIILKLIENTIWWERIGVMSLRMRSTTGALLRQRCIPQAARNF
jgi:hypothetical protein